MVHIEPVSARRPTVTGGRVAARVQQRPRRFARRRRKDFTEVLD